MSLNVPTYNVNDISFGPGRLFLGAAGTTPTVDVGAITEDGITVSPTNTTRAIMQGNPKLPIYHFNQEQGLTLECGSIEWDFTNIARALGAGNTTSGGGVDSWSFGGEPLTKQIAAHVQHQMAVTGNTLNLYVWKAVTNGNPQLPFGHDEHQFSFSFTAQRVTTNWAGATLPYNEQLFRVERLTA